MSADVTDTPITGTRTDQTAPQALPIRAWKASPQTTSSIDIAQRLTLLTGSAATLLLDTDGPPEIQPVPSSNPQVRWQNRQSTVGSQGQGQGQGQAKSTYDLVVYNDQQLPGSPDSAESTCQLLIATAAQIAIISAAGPAAKSLGQPFWAGLLAEHGYTRAFNVDLGLVPHAVVLYRPNDGPLSAVVGQYEAELAKTDPAQTGIEARLPASADSPQAALLAARHAALIDRDRVFGVMARMTTLQNEADYKQMKIEQQRRDIALLTKQLREVKRGTRYRIGNIFVAPFGAIKRLLGKSGSAGARRR